MFISFYHSDPASRVVVLIGVRLKVVVFNDSVFFFLGFCTLLLSGIFLEACLAAKCAEVVD